MYKKLVRDKIPEIIKGNNQNPITRILSDEEYKFELEKKLNEEYQEVLNASGNDRIEELDDLLVDLVHLLVGKVVLGDNPDGEEQEDGRDQQGDRSKAPQRIID